MSPCKHVSRRLEVTTFAFAITVYLQSLTQQWRKNLKLFILTWQINTGAQKKGKSYNYVMKILILLQFSDRLNARKTTACGIFKLASQHFNIMQHA